MRLAASRIFCTAGKSRPIKTAMMAITTKSSISVNACRARDLLRLTIGEDERRIIRIAQFLGGAWKLEGRSLVGPMGDYPAAILAHRDRRNFRKGKEPFP